MKNNLRTGVIVTLLGSALFAVVGTALAQGQPVATDCASIEAPDERLACYDAAAGPESVPVPAPQPDDFGLSKSKSETEGESLTGQVVGVWQDAYRKLSIELDNGQVWRQIESKRFSVEVGDVVVIRHGSVGSYKLYVDGEDGWIRVRREE